MEKEYFRLHTAYASYDCEVWLQYPTLHKVFVGGKRKCVAVTVYLDEEEEDGESMPQLEGVVYDVGCNLAKNHQRDIGTGHIVRVAMAFVLERYKAWTWAKNGNFQLKDVSDIPCDEGRYRMSLAYYSVMLYGKTYYERKFGAVPLKMSAKKWKALMQGWKDFAATKPANIRQVIGAGVRGKRYAVLTDVYAKSENVEDFIKRLKEVYDCMVYKDWAEELVKQYVPGLIGMSWVIPAGKLDLPQVEISKQKERHMSGGGMGERWEELRAGIA